MKSLTVNEDVVDYVAEMRKRFDKLSKDDQKNVLRMLKKVQKVQNKEINLDEKKRYSNRG